jgi:hypothetical protein
VKKSLLVVHRSELIIQALVDTLCAALLSDVVLVGYLVEWSGFALTVQSGNPLTTVTKSCFGG